MGLLSYALYFCDLILLNNMLLCTAITQCDLKMKNLNPKAALIVGIILLLIGAVLYWQVSSPNISAEDQATCERVVQIRFGGDSNLMIDRCKQDVGFVAMTIAQSNGAKSAKDLAGAISEANNQDSSRHMVYMFFLGVCLMLGVVLTIQGIKGLKQN